MTGLYLLIAFVLILIFFGVGGYFQHKENMRELEKNQTDKNEDCFAKTKPTIAPNKPETSFP